MEKLSEEQINKILDKVTFKIKQHPDGVHESILLRDETCKDLREAGDNISHG